MISVTVIVPTFNSARFLREALASIAAQTYPPRQVLVVDGPSTDATPEIVRAFPHFQYLRQRGSGMWNALNEGIARAEGDALAFLSSDDLWHPEKLRLQCEWLDAHPETQIVFCHAELQAMERGGTLSTTKPELFAQEHPAYMTEAMLARRSVFAALGNFSEEMRINSDMDWFGRMVDARVSTHVLPDILLTRRFHERNLSTAQPSGALYNRELLNVMREKILRARQGDSA